MTLSIFLYIVAAVIFAVEAIRGRSWLAVGLAVFTLAHVLAGVILKAG